MKRIIRLTENGLRRIVSESVKRALREGVEFQSDDVDDEIMYYRQKVNDAYDELAHIYRANGNDDESVEELKRYISMMNAHIRKLERESGPTPTMGQILKNTPLVNY